MFFEWECCYSQRFVVSEFPGDMGLGVRFASSVRHSQPLNLIRQRHACGGESIFAGHRFGKFIEGTQFLV